MRGNVANVVEQGRQETSPGPDAFRVRMEDQCHRIRQYQLEILQDGGRLLSTDEAALEWIERYAASFACDYPVQ
ncbi:MAG TPA: hypothetical protein VIV27_08575 [Halioglobus sp.]